MNPGTGYIPLVPRAALPALFRGLENGFYQRLRRVLVARRRQPQADDNQFARGHDGGVLAVVTFHPERVPGNSVGGVGILAGLNGIGAPEPDQTVSILAAG